MDQIVQSVQKAYWDGLADGAEAAIGTSPAKADTDGDGVPDRIEVEREADPTDPSDGGQAPPPELFRTLAFNIYGDWAAWKMQIEGLGPEDTRTRRISMGTPAASETSTMKMRKGNSYRLSMRWLNYGGHHDENAPWYCWQAQIDGMPGGDTAGRLGALLLAGGSRRGTRPEVLHRSPGQRDGGDRHRHEQPRVQLRRHAAQQPQRISGRHLAGPCEIRTGSFLSCRRFGNPWC